MDSTYKVPYTTVVKIESHPNADSLELAFCYGFQLIVPKNKYKIGSKVVYVPIDSILSPKVEALVFPLGSKVKLNKSRVRQIKLRGSVSEGLIIDPETLSGIVNFNYLNLEDDLSEILNIKKYEPPERKIHGNIKTGVKTGRKKLFNPSFHSYNGLTNLKWAELLFEGNEVVIQEKIHGSNARCGILPRPIRSIFDKIKRYFGLFPKYEYVYGSNNVDITNSASYNGYYGEDIYGKVFQRIKAKERLKPNEIVYGELYGPGIQKGYSYGRKDHGFILFDVKVFDNEGNHKWLNPDEVELFAKERGFDFVPTLYRGPFNLEMAYKLSAGPSVLCPDELVREGCVVKLLNNYSIDGNKQALKVINKDYLADNKNTDFH